MANDRFYYGYVVVAGATLVMIVCMSFHFAFGVFFKPILNEFGWSRSMTSGAFSFSWIVSGLVAIPLGALNDRAGSRIVVMVCGIILCAGYILMAVVNEVWHLYFIYGIIIGCGLGYVIPLMSTITRWFTRQRNLMTGILLSGGGIAAFIGPPVAEYLIRSFDWRTSYIIAGIVVLLVMVPAAQVFRRKPPSPKAVEGNNPTAAEHPGTSLTPRQAMATGRFWQGSIIFFCLGYCLYAIQIHFAPHLTDIGFSPAAAARILAIMGASSVVGRLTLGGSGDKIGNRWVYIIAFSIIALSLISLLFTRDELGLTVFAIAFGIGYGGGVSSQSPLAARLFGMKSHGMVLGIMSVGFTLGAAIAPLLMGFLYDIMGTYQAAFMFTIAIALLGVILTSLLKLPADNQVHPIEPTASGL